MKVVGGARNHPDWCRCLHCSRPPGSTRVNTRPTNRLLLAYRFSPSPYCWIGITSRCLPVLNHTMPMRDFFIYTDSVWVCHDGNDRRHTSPLADCLERRTLQPETACLVRSYFPAASPILIGRLHHLVTSISTCDRRILNLSIGLYSYNLLRTWISSGHSECRFRSPHDRRRFSWSS